MNPETSGARASRILDLCLDLLIVLVLLGAPLIFYTRANDVFEFNKLTAVRAFSALAAILYLSKLLFVRPLPFFRSATDFPLLAWLAISVVATIHTVNLNLSLHGVYEDFEGITTVVNYAFLLFLVQQQISSERQIRMIVGALILAGTVSGFYGMLQNFGIDFVPWNPSTYSADRMFSTMGNPNFLAAYLVMSLPVCLAVFLDLPEKIRTDRHFCSLLVFVGLVTSAGLCLLFKVNYFNFDPAFYAASSVAGILLSQKFWIMHILLAFPVIAALLLYFGRLKLVLLVSMFFQVVAILFTKSRGAGIAMLAIFLCFALYFAWDSRRNSEVLRRNRYWLLGMGLLLGLSHFIPQVRDTTTHMFGRIYDLLSFTNVRMTPRLYIWRSALQMMRDHFWLGTGLDTFQISFPPYRSSLYWILEWNGTPEKAHNMVMQIAATMGFAGLVAFFWLLVAFVARVFADLKEQADSSRRLLMAGGLAAVGAFLVQNMFSFTVVGYGATFWALLGFLPAMQRVWARDGGVELPAVPAQRQWPYRIVVSLLALAGLACLLAGTHFHLSGQALYLRFLLVACGLAALVLLFVARSASLLRSASYILLALVSVGYLVFSVHSVRIWVADSFYKLGQIGTQMNNPGYAAMVYQKAAGRIESISQDQERGLLLPEVPSDPAKRISRVAGLNADQELYWVKMGITFEGAAAQSKTAEDKMKFFRTALAIHQLTLEMNPQNGYNYNNKGRVLKTMGETFGYRDFFVAAEKHYKKAIGLDPHNVYFNLDYANTLLNLGDYEGAMKVSSSMMEQFSDFALPYYYAGIIRQRQAQEQGVAQPAMSDGARVSPADKSRYKAEALAFFNQAMTKDWKREYNSRALTAANLGMLHQAAGRDAEAEAAFNEALATNPDIPDAVLASARLKAKHGRKAQAIELLKAFQTRNPGNEAVLRLLQQLGG